jgi:hypothetical protein
VLPVQLLGQLAQSNGGEPVSSDPLDDLDEFVSAVTLASGQTNQLPGLCDEDGPFRGIAHHGDTSSSPELKETFLTQDAKGTKDGVRVDFEHGCEVSCRRKPITWIGFS